MSSLLHRIYQGETNVDFIGKRLRWFGLSAVILALCALTLIVNGLNYGIEFEGGVSIQAPVPADGPLGDAEDLEVIEEVRSAVADFGAGDAQIQVATDGDERSIVVQTKEIADPEEQDRLDSTVTEIVGADPADVDRQSISSSWGGEITRKAVRALIVFILVVLVFISFWFEWKMAVASVIALLHDLLITAGVYSLVGFEVTPSTVIAILTILGYSLYDTVVVFDKVEENTGLYATSGKMTYRESANLAINQVFMRSLNTSLSTILPVAALLFIGAGALGAETLKDLALALLVGLLVGSYSSIFIATPLLSIMKENEPRFKNVREKALRDARRSSQKRDAGTETDERELATAGAPARTATATSTKARAGSKKARRRKRR